MIKIQITYSCDCCGKKLGVHVDNKNIKTNATNYLNDYLFENMPLGWSMIETTESAEKRLLCTKCTINDK